MKLSAVRKRRIHSGVARRAPLSGFRLVIALIALSSFICQSYLVQTHIHGLPQTVLAHGDTGSVVNSSGTNSPADQDSANCLLCQEFLHAGNFVLPATIVALPPMLAVSAIVAVVAAVLAVKPTSHSWVGRAPPHA